MIFTSLVGKECVSQARQTNWAVLKNLELGRLEKEELNNFGVLRAVEAWLGTEGLLTFWRWQRTSGGGLCPPKIQGELSTGSLELCVAPVLPNKRPSPCLLESGSKKTRDNEGTKSQGLRVERRHGFPPALEAMPGIASEGHSETRQVPLWEYFMVPVCSPQATQWPEALTVQLLVHNSSPRLLHNNVTSCFLPHYATAQLSWATAVGVLCRCDQHSTNKNHHTA